MLGSNKCCWAQKTDGVQKDVLGANGMLGTNSMLGMTSILPA